VGRGNQVNGVIALNRPRGAEAAAGKNPISHPGKIYNVLANHLAAQIWKNVEGIREVTVWMCSRVGDPVNQPRLISIRLNREGSAATGSRLAERVREIVQQRIADIEAFIEELVIGRYWVC
jgi:S-adenosylmethionine synthetase